MNDSKKAIRYADVQCSEDPYGFKYWNGLPPSGRTPKFYIPELTAETVGWKRYWVSGSVIGEVIRLPDGYRWLVTGAEMLSDDGRDYTRTGLTDPPLCLPDVLDYTTAFTKKGYLNQYMIWKQTTGEPRIERKCNDGIWRPIDSK